MCRIALWPVASLFSDAWAQVLRMYFQVLPVRGRTRRWKTSFNIILFAEMPAGQLDCATERRSMSVGHPAGSA